MLDQPAGGTLEFKPKPAKRPSPFSDFAGWGSGSATKAPKPAPTVPKAKVAPKPIGGGSALGAAFKKAIDAMKHYVKALEQNPQNANDIATKESNAVAAQSELSVAIAGEVDLMCYLKQADTPKEAILKVVEAHVGNKKVDPASEVLFREAAKEALNPIRTWHAPQK